MLLETSRTASVQAVENTELLCLTKESLFDKIKEDPKFANRLITTLAQKLAHFNDIISELEGEKRSLEIIYGVQ